MDKCIHMQKKILRKFIITLIMLFSSQLHATEAKWFTDENPYPFGFEVDSQVQSLFMLAPKDMRKAIEQMEVLLNQDLKPEKRVQVLYLQCLLSRYTSDSVTLNSCSKEGLELSKTLNNEWLYMNFLIAAASIDNLSLTEAIEKTETAERWAVKNDDLFTETEAIVAAGLIYIGNDSLSLSLTKLQIAYERAPTNTEAISLISTKNTVLRLIADTYLKIGDYKTAIDYRTQYISILNEFDMKDLLIREKFKLIQLYILNQQYSNADEIFRNTFDDVVETLPVNHRFSYFIYKADLLLFHNDNVGAHKNILAAENLHNTHKIKYADKKLAIRQLKLAIQVNDADMAEAPFAILDKLHSEGQLSTETEIQMLKAKAFFLAKQGDFQKAYELSNLVVEKTNQLMVHNMDSLHQGIKEFTNKISAREQIHSFRRVKQEKEQNIVLFLVILAGVLGVTSIVSFMLIKNRKLASEMTELATHDELTTLKNRRFGLELVTESLLTSSKTQSKMAIGVLDIDHFKTINDNYGHLFGDEVLKTISQCFKDNLRSTDILLRYGGEEFIVAMPNTSYTQSVIFFNRLRESVKTLSVVNGDQKINLSLSVGVTDTDGTEPLEFIIKRADDALYKAKDLGRDRVEGIQLV